MNTNCAAAEIPTDAISRYQAAVWRPVMGTRASNEPLRRLSIEDFTITEEAPTRAFSWLKASTSTFTFKTLLKHYAKRALTRSK